MSRTFFRVTQFDADTMLGNVASACMNHNVDPNLGLKLQDIKGFVIVSTAAYPKSSASISVMYDEQKLTVANVKTGKILMIVEHFDEVAVLNVIEGITPELQSTL
jgi:hypothetical protein